MTASPQFLNWGDFLENDLPEIKMYKKNIVKNLISDTLFITKWYIVIILIIVKRYQFYLFFKNVFIRYKNSNIKNCEKHKQSVNKWCSDKWIVKWVEKDKTQDQICSKRFSEGNEYRT